MLNARIKLRHLTAFLDVAATRSLVRSSANLSISQPGLSKTIRELETLLDAELFARSPKGMALTASGRAFLRYAGPALQGLEQGMASVARINEQAVVRIGALSSVEDGLLPRVLARTHEVLPRLQAQVTTGSSRYLLSELRLGKLDLVVGRMSEAGAIRDLHFEHLFHEPLVLVARDGHPLAGVAREALSMEVLARFAWVVPPPGTTLRDRIEQFWVEAGGSPSRIALETLSLPLSRRYVGLSDALWVAPLDAIRHDLADAHSTLRLLVSLEARGGSVGLCTNPAQTLERGAEQLCELFRQEAAAHPRPDPLLQ
ncbi:LysR substrate-binding domain-containing protein [Larsenimonas suaedae]|uniref:LysR substrate-binding domain-containing protein n=1 Tax=Larsenimonas suaedae TaxID=1851019 RepID=A0ABU1GYK4_9GAMM|nr:LysR substrate-binding domain-containing protein [Larsenimonas suaedae]MCM2973552.1 LysR substrate-binding domain-containing protein [Larsenimonas suaedae]MDR5897078.1 LysR substrate-binding domain-containing protein [Larsenimonas suaedae]